MTKIEQECLYSIADAASDAFRFDVADWLDVYIFKNVNKGEPWR